MMELQALQHRVYQLEMHVGNAINQLHAHQHSIGWLGGAQEALQASIGELERDVLGQQELQQASGRPGEQSARQSERAQAGLTERLSRQQDAVKALAYIGRMVVGHDEDVNRGLFVNFCLFIPRKYTFL